MRETTVVKVVSSFGENAVHFIVGLIFMAAGGWVGYFALRQEPHSDKLLYVGIGLGIFGALLMPTILPVVKQIIVVITPFIPLVGGKRAGDPPAPPAGGAS